MRARERRRYGLQLYWPFDEPFTLYQAPPRPQRHLHARAAGWQRPPAPFCAERDGVARILAVRILAVRAGALPRARRVVRPNTSWQIPRPCEPPP